MSVNYTGLAVSSRPPPFSPPCRPAPCSFVPLPSSLSGLCSAGWVQCWRFSCLVLYRALGCRCTPPTCLIIFVSWNPQHFHFYFLVSLLYLKKFFLNSKFLSSTMSLFHYSKVSGKKSLCLACFSFSPTTHFSSMHSFAFCLPVKIFQQYHCIAHWCIINHMKAWEPKAATIISLGSVTGLSCIALWLMALAKMQRQKLKLSNGWPGKFYHLTFAKQLWDAATIL